MTSPTLFDDRNRTDSARALRRERIFPFLNRVGGKYWDQVRDLLELWFSRTPQDMRSDIASRFRSKDETQSLSAFWELYLHELLLKLGFLIMPHPSVPGSRRRPDFRIERGGHSLFVEAVMTIDPEDERRSEHIRGIVIDEVNKIESADFILEVDVLNEGDQIPSTKKLKKELAAWLESLDPDADCAPSSPNAGRNTFVWSERAWSLEFRAIPIQGSLTGSLVGRGPIRGKFVDDHSVTRQVLSEKADRYGDLEGPYVVALCSSRWTISDFQLWRALYGIGWESPAMIQRGALDPGLPRCHYGFFVNDQGPQHRGVSAVLTISGLFPWTVARCDPVMWLNPWAKYPIAPDIFPFASVQADLTSGTFRCTPAAGVSFEIIGVPKDWPIGEPFEDV